MTTRPATNAREAHERFARLAALDGPQISAAGRSRLLATDARCRTAVALIHGFTNCPQQWMTFAAQLASDGYAVVIPRLPGHGFADLRTRAIARVTTAELLATVDEAVDIAAGLAERVVVAGLSIGGSLALRLALRRADVATAVAIVPFLGLKPLGPRGNAVAALALTAFPNVFVPWDPSGKNATIPPYGYTHFPSRVLGECLQLGATCYALANTVVGAGAVRFLLNAEEPAVNNGMALEVARRLERNRSHSTQSVVMDGLPANHDIIDPTNPFARTAVVYPRVRALIDS